MYIILIVTLLISAVINGQERLAPNITLISQFGAYADVNCVLLKNNLESEELAMTWIEPISPQEPKDSPVSIFSSTSVYDCNFDAKDEERCNAHWVTEYWKLQNSYLNNFNAVTDYRWEDFEVVHTNGRKAFKQITYTDTVSFKINFSVRMERDANVYLCNGNSPTNADCYWILIAGWEGTETALRKCNSYDIPYSENEYPKNLCKPRQISNFLPNMLNSMMWNHFTLEKQRNNILLWRSDIEDPVLNYTDHNKPFTNINTLIINSYGTPGLWKFHNYYYLLTVQEHSTYLGESMHIRGNYVCFSIFVAMCEDCNLKFQVVLDNGLNYYVSPVTISPIKEFQWQHERIIFSLPGNDNYVRLIVTTHNDYHRNNPFWALDKFRICSTNEVRILTKTHDTGSKISCQVIQYPNWNVTLGPPSLDYNKESNCNDVNKIGKNCIDCNSIFKSQCREAAICEITADGTSKCSCVPGFRGRTCNEPCANGNYGINCRQSCGFCSFLPCDTTTGACLKGQCVNDMVGVRCQTPNAPVLLYPPEILEIKHTSAIVQLTNFSHKGLGEPKYYSLQYRKLHSEWVTAIDTNYIEDANPIEITKLDVSTEYEIRALLISSDGKTYNKDNVVPVRNFTTTCEFVKKDDIIIKPFNTSTILTFKFNSESCKSEDYIIYFRGVTITSNKFNFEIHNLQPFTDYNLFITDIRHEKNLNIQFKTAEGVPNAVTGVTTSADVTKILLRWSPPKISNGIIKYYEIQFNHSYYVSCLPTYINKTNEFGVIQVTNTFYEITNLLPYSGYKIKITPYTIMQGIPYLEYADTKSSEMPDDNEIPKIQNTKSTDTTVYIQFEIPNCADIKGPWFLYTTSECSNPWCKNLQKTLNNFSEIEVEKGIEISKLLPYSNYTTTMQVKRTSGKYSTGNVIAKFDTNEGVPNVVKDIVAYSKTENSIDFRILPPYPPTGQIFQYKLEYCYKYWKTYCKETILPLTKCKLWENFHCVSINQLEKETQYTIKVQARNTNSKFGPTKSKNVITVQEVSEPPENLTASWDDFYNLRVTWNHPSITNGPLKAFTVAIQANRKNCYEKDIAITEDTYRITYTHEARVKESCLSSALTIIVEASNKLKGKQAELQNVFSPPPTPQFQTEPFIETVTNTSVKLRFGKVQKTQNSVMYVFISNAKTDAKTDKSLQTLWEKYGLSPNLLTWIVGEFYKNSEKFPQELVIGNNNTMQSKDFNVLMYNSPLQMNTTYLITIVLSNKFKDYERFKIYKLSASTTGSDVNEGSQAGFYALLLLLIIPVLVYGFIVRKKIHKYLHSVSIRGTSSVGRDNNPDVIPLTTNKVQSKPEPSANVNIQQAKPADKFSKPVKLTEFEEYVKRAIANGELEEQHQMFPRGQTRPWNYGLLPPNKSKNRYNNLVAYDHTRVKLEKINNEPYSDYINANYIKGYNNNPKAYIATQGPKPSTVNDFWRMVWQENINYIVMLANVTEGGKKKTEQYWPNVNATLQFKNIKVQYVSTQLFADYEYRTFSVSCENEERILEQLHFTSWPDHGVPIYSQSLVPFLRKILTIPQKNSPVLVHCSAGVGRTGTIILCDLCLRMAAREGIVDVLKHQSNIRAQRVNMVDNVEQYKLVHLVLLDSLIAPNTSISCDEKMEQTILQLLKSDKVKEQMQYLHDINWQDQAMRPEIKFKPKIEWNEKNRFQEIIPSGHGRIYLTRFPVTEENSDYINAIEVDGFRTPKLFIVTQQPLPNTVSDFWRMIDEKEVKVIVSLNEIDASTPTSCTFWPTEEINKIKPVPFITLQYYDESDNEYYKLITIYLYNSKNNKSEKRVVHILAFKGWDSTKQTPKDAEGLLKLWEETERVSTNENAITVTCFDGATASGLFLALTFVVEKMKLEQQCDVCLAVRTVRHNRKQFIANVEQFSFLYRAALSYLSCFELYANFTNASQK